VRRALTHISTTEERKDGTISIGLKELQDESSYATNFLSFENADVGVAHGTVALNNCTSSTRPTYLLILTVDIDLQKSGHLALLSWDDRTEGPQHAPIWTCTCKSKPTFYMLLAISENIVQ